MAEANANRSVLVTVQWLRFWAAVIVVLSHVMDRVAEMQARYSLRETAIRFDGQFGVYIFFVISGFIMVYISGDRFGQSGAARHFAVNRIVRIVPLYWLLTLAQAAKLLFEREFAGSDTELLSWQTLTRSLLFVPYLNANGKHRPVLEQGWTLDFEMMFYAVFAACLLLPRRYGLPSCLIALAAIAGASALEPRLTLLAIWCDPIVLYFGAGICLALLREWLVLRSGLFDLPAPLMCTLALCLTFAVQLNAPFQDLLKPIIVIGTVAIATLCRDQDLRRHREAIVTNLGAISYSIYLSHGFVLLVVGIAWRNAMGGQILAIYAVLASALSVYGGYLCYTLVERRLGMRLSRAQVRSMKARLSAS
jgi:exopolysaccharide production protein ExoZ